MSSFIPFDDQRTLLLNSGVIDPKLVSFPNEIFLQPEPPAIWVVVQSTGNILDPVDIGANVWREEGTNYYNVMVPSGWGTDDARKLAKDIANVYRNLPPRTVTYRSGSIGDATSADTEGMYWLITVSVDWIYDDTTGPPAPA